MGISLNLSNCSVLVTGGMGFIGSHLAERARSRGADVSILDARLDNSGANEANVEDLPDDVKLVTGDVSDPARLEGLVEGTDLIFHLAAQVSRVDSNKHPRDDVRTNCIGTLNILQAAQRSSGTPRVVFTSSRAVYGPANQTPVSESDNTEPIDIYGINKLSAEQYCSVYDGNGVETTVARLANVYGPRAQIHNTNYGVLNVFVRKAIESETLTVFEPGTMLRDCVFVSDVVDALVALGTHPETDGEIYNVGTGEGYSILEIANQIVDIAGTGSVELVPWPDDWQGMKVGDFVADVSKIEHQTGWEPAVSIESGLRESVDFYRSNLESYV